MDRQLPRFDDGVLFVFISGHAREAWIAVRDTETGAEYRYVLERECAKPFATYREGRATCVYRGEEANNEAIIAQTGSPSSP